MLFLMSEIGKISKANITSIALVNEMETFKTFENKRLDWRRCRQPSFKCILLVEKAYNTVVVQRSKYSITSMARTRMARLPWMIRTRFSVPTKSFQ